MKTAPSFGPEVWVNIGVALLGSYSVFQNAMMVYNSPELGFVFLAFEITFCLFVLFLIFGVILKRKFGWILLVILLVVKLANFISEGIITYLLKNEEWYLNLLFEDFTYYFNYLVIPLGVIFYINKPALLKVYKVSKKAQKVTLLVCTCFGLSIIANGIFLYYHLN